MAAGTAAAGKQEYRAKRGRLVAMLAKLPNQGLAEGDTRAIAKMPAKIESFPGNLEHAPNTMAPVANGNDIARQDLDFGPLRNALYAFFDKIGNRLEFEGTRLTRLSALDMQARIEEPVRRQGLFMAFAALWQAVNGSNLPDSPCRRLMGLAVVDMKKNGSPVEAAARAAGAPSREIESWLEQILEAWRQSSGAPAVEPWDFYYLWGEAGRVLAASIPRESVERIAAC